MLSPVRFQVLFGVASVAWPWRTGDPGSVLSGGNGAWYGWRLIGANNRELGRSAIGFGSYQGARLAVLHLQRGTGRLVQHSITDRATGRWGWRFELDGATVAVSGRWYERDQEARLGAAKFVSLALRAALVDGVLALPDRRGPGTTDQPGPGAPEATPSRRAVRIGPGHAG